jgi:predicted aspartyl protease
MKIILPMSRFNNLIMVDVFIWNVKWQKYNQMLITLDTGASVTTISSDILHKLGYDVTSGNSRRITTASGIEYVRALNIEKLKIGSKEQMNVEIYAHSFPQESFSLGVLGLNVLQKFDVNLLFSRDRIELTEIE